MFPASLVDMNPKDGELAHLNADPNFFSVNDGRRCTLGKAVPKDELKHIGHTLLNRTIDDTGHGYVEWDSENDYFTVEDGRGARYKSSDFAFASQFLFSGEELLSAGNHAASRMKKLADKSLRHLYKDGENAGYRNGHPTLGGRKGAAKPKNIAIGAGIAAIIAAGIYLIAGMSGGSGADKDTVYTPNKNITTNEIVTPATTYPDFKWNESIPMELAIKSHETITPLDPVKDLGNGRYEIGDVVIDTTDDVPDAAVAYGGVNLFTVPEIGEKWMWYKKYLYVDEKALEANKFYSRVGESTPEGGTDYGLWWGPSKIKNGSFKEIKPNLFAYKAGIEDGSILNSYQFTARQPQYGYDQDVKYPGFIIPLDKMKKYFKCDMGGFRCQR